MDDLDTYNLEEYNRSFQKLNELVLEYDSNPDAVPNVNADLMREIMAKVSIQYIWDVFYQTIQEFSLEKDLFLEYFCRAYCSSNASDDEVIELYEMFGCRLNDMLSSKELRQYYSALPEYLTLYRGASIEEMQRGFGISWTLDRGTAEFFAFRGLEKGAHVTFQISVPKHDIKALILERREEEVLIFDADRYSPIIITDHPTSYLDEYYDRKNMK